MNARAQVGSPGPLLTDLYQLNMMQAYLDRGETKTATFEMFFRKLPARRGFLVAAGLEQALEFLETVRFGAEDLEWLTRSGLSILKTWSDVFQVKMGLAGEHLMTDATSLPTLQPGQDGHL